MEIVRARAAERSWQSLRDEEGQAHGQNGGGSVSRPFFELPVKLVSRPGSDFKAKCGEFTASCTASAEGAMRAAAAKAMNASGKPMIAAGVTVSAADMEIVGEGRECKARYYLMESRGAGAADRKYQRGFVGDEQKTATPH